MNLKNLLTRTSYSIIYSDFMTVLIEIMAETIFCLVLKTPHMVHVGFFNLLDGFLAINFETDNKSWAQIGVSTLACMNAVKISSNKIIRKRIRNCLVFSRGHKSKFICSCSRESSLLFREYAFL